MSTAETEIPLLDVLVKIRGTFLYTDMYYIDTDTHNYVPFDSCLPHHTKTNIPYCLAHRICPIVYDQNMRNQRFIHLRSFLKAKRYPDKLIEDGISKSQIIPLASLCSHKGKQSTPQL